VFGRRLVLGSAGDAAGAVDAAGFRSQCDLHHADTSRRRVMIALFLSSHLVPAGSTRSAAGTIFISMMASRFAKHVRESLRATSRTGHSPARQPIPELSECRGIGPVGGSPSM